ncbi:MAG: ferredoxin, partial [Rhizobacter sp.]|nr:ferredoxin [Rhizobacter sp.]
AGEAAINQCPPGGAEGVRRLAALTGREPLALNPDNGTEGPRAVAVIDEAWCIGCTLCLAACPVDAIIGAPKLMHTVIDALCTGCELCVPVCPVDCISLVDASGGRTGWDAWTAHQADEARERYAFHRARMARDAREHDERLAARGQGALEAGAPVPAPQGEAAPQRKLSLVEAALERARSQRAKP